MKNRKIHLQNSLEREHFLWWSSHLKSLEKIQNFKESFADVTKVGQKVSQELLIKKVDYKFMSTRGLEGFLRLTPTSKI